MAVKTVVTMNQGVACSNPGVGTTFSSTFMMMWKTRNKSLELLEGDFKGRADIMEEMFSLIDGCIELFEKKSNGDAYHRFCGLTLLKAKNLSLGCYSLFLDGLGQEAGALLRPLIEYNELITYFTLDPSRIQEAMDDNLPSPGKRAQIIEGDFKEFREHLNEHASHSTYSYYSLNHLLDKPTMGFRKVQQMFPKVLDKNIGDLFAHMLLLTREALRCLDTMENGYADSQISIYEELKAKGIREFELDKRSEKKV